jgi:hypothetical protein
MATSTQTERMGVAGQLPANPIWLGDSSGPQDARHPLMTDLVALSPRMASAMALRAFPCARNAIVSRIASCSATWGTSSPSSPQRNPKGTLPPR